VVGIDRRLLQNVDWPLVGATLGLVTLSASTLAASSAALMAPALPIASVPTGTPAGIWTME